MWLLLFVPGPPERPEKGIVLGFWMGKDSKDRPLGDRGSTGGPGFAESGRPQLGAFGGDGARVPAEGAGTAADPDYKFQPMMRDAAVGERRD